MCSSSTFGSRPSISAATFRARSTPHAACWSFEIHGLVDRSRHNLNVPHEDTPIVLYCGTGGRSALAAKTLEELGYTNVKSMAGGIVAWAQAQLPLAAPG